MDSRIRSFVLGLGLALGLVGTADVMLRVFEARLSGNMAATKTFPRQIADLSRFNGMRALAIGNSLLGDALDLKTFQSSVSQHELARPMTATKLVPDGSSIWDWYCIVNHGVRNGSSAPDMVILGFAWDQLADQTRLNITRSFNGLCSFNSMVDIQLLSGQVGANEWLEMITVKLSKLYAQREAIRHRALGAFVPAYQEITQTMNGRAGVAETPNRATSGARSYKALESMLESLGNSGSRVLLVAMPVSGNYEIDPRLCDLAERKGHFVLDMRKAVPATRRYFRDALHMNREGAQMFSQILASEVRSPVMRTMDCTA